MYNRKSSKHRMPGPAKVLIFLVFASGFVFLLGNVIMYLWNEILVIKTGVQAINFWEAIGLLILSRILFGGFRMGSRRRHWKGAGRREWKDKWKEMSESDREALKQKWKARCEKKRQL